MDLLQRVSLVSDGENYEAKRLSRPHRLGDLVRSSESEPLRADRLPLRQRCHFRLVMRAYLIASAR
jgi:hypothetical protein